MSGDTRTAAARYIAEGLAPVPAPRGAKGPRSRNWQHTTFAAEDFETDGNIGIKLGDPSNGIVDVDCDCAEAITAAPELLRVTGRVHGRASRRRSHYWYRCPGLKSIRYTAPDGSVLVEIRSTGGQTIVPPSLHGKSGEAIEWEEDGEPATIEPEELIARVRLVATAALLSRFWPNGARHDAAGAAAGFLAAQGVEPAAIERLIRVVAVLARDEEASDRARFAGDTARKAAASPDNPTTGGTKLAELIGDEPVKRLRAWFGVKARTAEDTKIFETLNQRWFLVDVGNDTVVGEEITEVDERSGRTWTEFAFRSFDAFKRKYVRHRTTRFKNGRMQDAAVADVFLEEACARQYNRLVYAPPGSGIALGADDLDGWRGFTVAPKAGDWTKNKAHIRDVICAGNDVLFEWTLDWCAALFQRPGQHAETSLVLRGGQGTGKGHFADVMLGRSFDGRHYRSITNLRRVFGEFNDILSGLCLLFLDEVDLTRPDWAQQNKSLITSHTLDINRKFLKTATEQSMLHQICASNKAKPLSVEFDDRRYAIYEVSDTHAKNITYFKALCDELANGGRAAMLYELLNRAVDWDAQRQPPDTRAKRIAKRDSWTPVQVFLAEMLETTSAAAWANTKNGEHRVAKGGDQMPTPKEMGLVDRYLAWRQNRGIRDAVPDVRRELSDAIRDHVPAGFTYNRAVKIGGKASKDFWTLPPRDTYRRSFAKARGIDEGDLAMASAADDALPFEDLPAHERQTRIEEAALHVFAVRERPTERSAIEAWPVGTRADGLTVYAARFVDADIAAQDSMPCPSCGNGVTDREPISELPDQADEH